MSGINMDALRARLSELKEATEQRAFWTPAQGSNRVRIMPPWNELGKIHTEAWVHWGLGETGRQMTFCPLKNKVGPCYVCEQVALLKASTKQVDLELAQRLTPNLRVMFNVVDRAAPEKGVQIWGTGIANLREIMSLIADPQWGDITDSEAGVNLVIERTGTNLGTRYTIRPERQPSPLDKSWLSQLHDLDAMVVHKTYDELKVMYDAGRRSGGGDEGDPTVGVPTIAPTRHTPVQVPAASASTSATVDVPDCYSLWNDANDPICKGCALFQPCANATTARQAKAAYVAPDGVVRKAVG